MGTFTRDLLRSKRDHPLITIGIVLAVLLLALLALPFLIRLPHA